MNAAEIQHAEMQSTVGRDCRESSLPSVCERPDSWKEIACYLRRRIPCVQRWKKNEGLPILRLHKTGRRNENPAFQIRSS